MKANANFLLREIADSAILVPIGEQIADFNGVVTLNETSLFLWKLLQQKTTAAILSKALAEEFNISEALAQKDVTSFLSELKQHHMLEDYDE